MEEEEEDRCSRQAQAGAGRNRQQGQGGRQVAVLPRPEQAGCAAHPASPAHCCLLCQPCLPLPTLPAPEEGSPQQALQGLSGSPPRAPSPHAAADPSPHHQRGSQCPLLPHAPLSPCPLTSSCPACPDAIPGCRRLKACPRWVPWGQGPRLPPLWLLFMAEQWMKPPPPQDVRTVQGNAGRQGTPWGGGAGPHLPARTGERPPPSSHPQMQADPPTRKPDRHPHEGQVPRDSPVTLTPCRWHGASCTPHIPIPTWPIPGSLACAGMPQGSPPPRPSR